MKLKTICIAVLFAAVCFTIHPTGVFAAEADTSWFDYLNPRTEYTISSEAELLGLASLVNEEQFMWKPNPTESFEGVKFTLTKDITLTDYWTPIGTTDQVTFCGVFDGAGHTIKGLNISYDSEYAGLFGYLSGTVMNLNVEGDCVSTEDYCGGIAGYVDEQAVVYRCNANINVSGASHTGGIAGFCSGGKITGCISSGNISGITMTGGIVGKVMAGRVRACGNRGTITSIGGGSFNNGTGGIAGQAVSGSVLYQCYNTGDINSANEATGGIVGYTNGEGTIIRSCYSIGNIRISPPKVEVEAFETPENEVTSGSKLPVYAGGVAGYVGSVNVELSNCYNAGSITNADFTGGIIGKCENALFTGEPTHFKNNYYSGSGFEGGIAADRDNKVMKIRGAAKEVDQSAFANLAADLGYDYMDDKTGEYGSKGYPVLTWQDKIQTEENIAVLDHVDPDVLRQLYIYKNRTSDDDLQRPSVIRFFNPDLIYAQAQEEGKDLTNEK